MSSALDVASELEHLQGSVPADPPGVARSEPSNPAPAWATLFRTCNAIFEKEPFASGSVAQVHRPTLADGTPVAVKVVHDGAADRVREDLDLMAGLAAYLEATDSDLAQLRPTILVDEFSKMMLGAIHLREELRNLERSALNFASTRPTSSSRSPYPDVSSSEGAHDVDADGRTVRGPRERRATGWDVDALLQRHAPS